MSLNVPAPAQDGTLRLGSMARWRILGASVCGAAHRRRGWPNQDAIGWWVAAQAESELPSGTVFALAVADGHGSAKCVRSAAGARFAVEAALDLARDWLCRLEDGPTALDSLARSIVERWRARVAADLQAAALTPHELAQVAQHDGPAASQLVEASPQIAYGATVLLAAVAGGRALYLQLGDGDLLVVDDGGQVSQPLAPDARLFAGETTSLCGPDAWKDVRLACRPLGDAPPALILLSTDGYANSFREPAGFLRVGGDLLEIIRAEGIDAVSASLEPWLEETSRYGSGDDVTLGLACRLDAVLPGPLIAGPEAANRHATNGLALALAPSSPAGSPPTGQPLLLDPTSGPSMESQDHHA